jgi:hypothetical protein
MTFMNPFLFCGIAKEVTLEATHPQLVWFWTLNAFMNPRPFSGIANEVTLEAIQPQKVWTLMTFMNPFPFSEIAIEVILEAIALNTQDIHESISIFWNS